MRLEKAAQLLALARRLASTPEGLTLDDMAATIGVHRRTAQRMRDALAGLFPQMEEIPDGKGKRFRITNGLDGLYQSPEPEELSTLAIAAEALRREGASARASALESLEVKIRSAMRDKTLRRMVPDLEALVRAECIAVQAGPRPAEDENLIAVIRAAILSMKQVGFIYSGGSNPGRRRAVIPYGLIFGRSNYLVAAAEGEASPKHWRLDRIAEPEVLGAYGAPPPDFDIRTHAAGSFGVFRDEIEDVLLRVSPAGASEALRWRFHPTQRIEHETDGGLLIRFRASGMLELTWHLFTWQDQITVLAPERLKSVMRDQLRVLCRHVGLEPDTWVLEPPT